MEPLGQSVWFLWQKGSGIQAGERRKGCPGGAVLSAELPVNTSLAPSSDLMVSPSLRMWQWELCLAQERC